MRKPKKKIIPLHIVQLSAIVLWVISLLINVINEEVTVMGMIFLLLTTISMSVFCVLSSYDWTGKKFKIFFREETIDFVWGSWICKQVKYTSVKGITIMGAVMHQSPIKEKDGRQRAFISVYNSPTICFGKVYPGSETTGSFEKEKLCYTFFDMAVIQRLLDKTDAIVYITAEIFQIYQDEIEIAFSVHPNRAKIAFYNKYGDRIFLSLSELKGITK